MFKIGKFKQYLRFNPPPELTLYLFAILIIVLIVVIGYRFGIFVLAPILAIIGFFSALIGFTLGKQKSTRAIILDTIDKNRIISFFLSIIIPVTLLFTILSFPSNENCNDGIIEFIPISNLEKKKDRFRASIGNLKEEIISLTFKSPECWDFELTFPVSSKIEIKALKKLIIDHFKLKNHIRPIQQPTEIKWIFKAKLLQILNEDQTIKEANINFGDEISLDIESTFYSSIPVIVDTICFGNVGKKVTSANKQFFSISDNYVASGFIGDVGDLDVASFPDRVVLKYVPLGREPHESNLKYLPDGSLNPLPAEFGGVIFQNPPDAYGLDSTDGYFLKNYSSRIEFEVKGYSTQSDSIYVEFNLPEITWVWGKDRKKKNTPYPGTLNWRPLGKELINKEWKPLKYDISDIEKREFCRVVGALACILDTHINGINIQNAPLNGAVDTLTLEIRNIRYIK